MEGFGKAQVRIMKKKQYFLLLIGLMAVFVMPFYFYYISPHPREIKRFGVTYMTMNNPFYEVINNELLKEIESRGDQLIVRDPLLNFTKQKEQIEQFIAMKVDGIFVNPVDSKALEPTLKKAKEAGIPVIAIDVPLSDSTSLVSTIVSDNYDAGVQCARHIMTHYDSGTIALLKHSAVQSASDRIRGFKDTIASDSRFRIVNEAECLGQLEIAMPQTQQMLQETPDVTIIMALNDPSALGAKAALKTLDRDDVRIYGVDGTPEMKTLIGQDPSISGTVAQSPYAIGQTAIRSMYDYLEGKPVAKDIVIEVEMIDEKTISRFSKGGWQ